ncbi:MAG: ParB N-terminal domain-containing protein [Leptospiraceae bacterium]|nr:ParB N-terminal domain-containing protein [Leptospiraceae bacterium]
MSNISDFLQPIDLKLEDILLDPNNPRFAELGEEVKKIPENRFSEASIQKVTFERMKVDKFDVSELKDTIKTLGFLPMDRIVVRKWNNSTSTKYIVIEGNRRVAALKWLMELNDSGKETFTEEKIRNFTEIPALLLDESADESLLWILPGLRHVSGIKEWGPYQKAKSIFVLRESGKTPQEVAQSLGLSTRAANQLWRAYLALEQMDKDDEYGEYADPKMFSYFDEVFRKANLRDWLEWDDSNKKFKNESRTKEFYSWFVGEIDENGDLKEPKLRESRDVRELSRIIDDQKALNIFKSSSGTLLQALAKVEIDRPDNWREVITSAEDALANLNIDKVRQLKIEDIDLLDKLKGKIEQIKRDNILLNRE